MVTDDISRAALRAARAEMLAKNFAHWARMDPHTWAETVRKMPDEHGGVRSFSFDYAPYQREMFEAVFDPRNQKVIFRLASRLGKSEVYLNAIGYFIDQSPRKILVMWPKNDDAEEWSKKHLMRELIEPTPQLDALIGDGRGRRQSSNTIKTKLFPGGYISMLGANVPGDFRRAKGNLLYADEIDAIAESESAKDEGDQLAQFSLRGSEYSDTIELLASYPALKEKSRITRELEASDYRRWLNPCLKCGFDRWEMRRSDMRYDPKEPENARIECPHCHELFTDAQRYEMSRLPDKWTPTRAFTGRAGFHAGCMLWPHPVSVEKYPGGFLHMLALEEIDAASSDNPERARRVIVNTRDAEPYEPEHIAKIEHTDLYLRREAYEPRENMPPDAFFVTFGGDVQADRAEIKFKAWGGQFADVIDPKTKKTRRQIVLQSWALDYRVVRGSPLQRELWEKCENILRNISWKHPSGLHLHVTGGLIDSRYKPDEVYKFCRRMLGLRIRCYPCEGSVTLGKPIVSPPARRGIPPIRVFEIGTHEAKDVIYQRLDLTDPAAQGYMHFPQLAAFSESYFKQLTIEDSTMQRGRDGNFYRFFWCPEGERNEPIDCEVYADAAERILRPDYAKLAETYRVTTGEEAKPAEETRRAPIPSRVVRGGLGQGWNV